MLVAISGDGMWGISASGNRSITLWDLEAAGDPTHFEDQMPPAVSADSKRAVTSRNDGSLVVWDFADEIRQRVLRGSKEMRWAYHSVVLSANGTRAISAPAKDGSFIAWDLETGEPHYLENASVDFADFISICADGSRAVVKLRDGPLVLWNLRGAWDCKILEGSESETTGTITDDGRFAITGLWNQSILVWDLETSRRSVTSFWRRKLKQLNLLNALQSKRVLRDLSVERGSTIPVGNAPLDPAVLADIPPDLYAVMPTITVSRDRRWAFVVSLLNDHEADVYVVNLLDHKETRRTVRRVSRRQDWPVPSADGTRFASASRDGTLEIRDIDAKALASFSADAPWTWLSWIGSQIMACDEAGGVHILALEEDASAIDSSGIM